MEDKMLFTRATKIIVKLEAISRTGINDIEIYLPFLYKVEIFATHNRWVFSISHKNKTKVN